MKSYALRDSVLLVLIGVFIYLPFLGVPAWDGNEPIRVIVAKEMMKTGDWLMPVLHGQPYFAKPPLMNWLIAASGSLFGIVNEWTSRFPSVLMMILTVLSVYFMTAKWLGRNGRFFAALMTLCMVGLLKKGREAEIESLHFFLIAVILLVWINGYVRQWKPLVLWGTTLTLVGIGFLSKGPQVVFFFYMTVVPYLFVRKRMSLFFSRGHVSGLLLLLLVLSLYMLSVLQWTTVDTYVQKWISEGIQRTESRHTFTFLQHFLTYPFEVTASFMPCVLFLIPVLIYKELRQQIKTLFNNEILMFSFIVVAANFPLYWLLPNMRTRYFLPVGPFAAVAVAVFFEFYLGKLRDTPALKNFFGKFLRVFAFSTIFVSVALIPLFMFLHLKISFLVLFILGCAFLSAIFVLYKSRTFQAVHIPLYVTLTIALFFLVYTNLDIQMDEKQEYSPRKIAREINLILPENADTVYEMGYRRFLPVTCYLKSDVRQLDTFAELNSRDRKNGKIYFIFDTGFLKGLSDEDKNVFLHELRWEKLYSKKYRNRRGEIIVGALS
ncbi:MAG: glycosyltransferase family 39 protein [Thermodesulfovibrionales bacterium]